MPDRAAGGAPGSTRRKAAEARSEPVRKPLAWTPFLLLALVPVPSSLAAGSVEMPLYRMVLLVAIVPGLVAWARGEMGEKRLADFALIAFCSWCTISLVVVHGPLFAVQPAGVIFLETLGAYMIGRRFVRGADDFYGVARLLYILVMCLLPFAIFETVTGRNMFRETFAMLLPTYPDVTMEPRWGLRRVQSGFNHPILFGVYTGCILGLVHCVLGYGETGFRRLFRTLSVTGTALLCFSSGPLTGLVGQAMLLGWNWILGEFKARWKLLLGLIGIFYLVVALFSNRSLAAILISYFAFDEGSAWVRILAWQYGSQSILNHPVFGVGFGPWDHPPWLTSSVDMYWIVDGIRHGLPASIFLAAAFLSALIPIALKRGLDDRAASYRLGYVVTMMGFFLAGWTVYYWNGVYVLFMFLMGSGMWIHDVSGGETTRGNSRMPRRRPEGNSCARRS
jgi:hypothetical protein